MSVATEQHLQARQHLPASRLIIGEQRLDKGSAGVFQHVNPSTGQVQANIPLGGKKEIDEAVAAARAGQKVWAAMPPSARANILQRFSDALEKDMPNLAVISALENGTSRDQIERHQSWRILGWMRYYAGWADKIEGQLVAAPPSEHLEYVVPEPYGVIGIIITWNAPLISLAMKVQPALAAGNAVVIKPAEFTPFTAQRFVELALQAGVPTGVINLVVGGVEAGEALVRHPGVDKITFTGGPIAARKIMAMAAENLTPVVFELGGKSANLVFADADLEFATMYSGAFPMNCAGQGCALPTRLLVEDSIYPAFVAGIQQVMQYLPVGDPLDSKSHFGPVVNLTAMERILSRIEEAKRNGDGTLSHGGARMGDGYKDGFFVGATLFTDVDPKSRLAQEEIFGPVLAVSRFKTEDEALDIANNTAYGLAAYIQTKDLARAHRMASALRAGSIHINGAPNIHPGSPFGGIGLSGFGKEGGKAGLDEFLRSKSVGIALKRPF